MTLTPDHTLKNFLEKKVTRLEELIEEQDRRIENMEAALRCFSPVRYVELGEDMRRKLTESEALELINCALEARCAQAMDILGEEQ